MNDAEESNNNKNSETPKAKVFTSSVAFSLRPLNLEKAGRKQKKVRKRAPENLVRRAGGLKDAKLKYADFQELYKLWCDYFKVLLEQMHNYQDERLLKADYHGCLLRVQQSFNPSQVGLYGIVAYESKYTFQLVTPKNKLIVIAKEGATFQFVFAQKVFTLFGDALKQKPHSRGRKQRAIMTLPYPLK